MDQVDRLVLRKGHPGPLDHGNNSCIILAVAWIALDHRTLPLAPLNLQMMARNITRLRNNGDVVALEEHIKSRRRRRVTYQKDRRDYM